MVWMDLDSAIEVVIGPYETYEDGLFGYKAAFETFICVPSPRTPNALAKFKAELPLLETQPADADEHKNFDRGSESPIRVVDEVYTAGDTRAGVQTIAFNLPNDERVREAKGCKKVLLKNMMHAKYDGILAPIAARVLPADGAGSRRPSRPSSSSPSTTSCRTGSGPGRSPSTAARPRSASSSRTSTRPSRRPRPTCSASTTSTPWSTRASWTRPFSTPSVDLHRRAVPLGAFRGHRGAWAGGGGADQLPARERRDRGHRRRPLRAGARGVRATPSARSPTSC